MEIDKDLIMVGLHVETKEEALEKMGRQLFEQGYVTEEFIPSVLKREQEYPTGLPTLPYAIAIPHTDSDKVIEPKIAIATLKETVPFSVMGNSNMEVDVKIIFMLALDSPDKQLETLKKLTGIFQNKEAVEKFGNVQNVKECEKLLQSF